MVKVITRTHLILDIFAANAKTAQAKTQVELAQSIFMLPVVLVNFFKKTGLVKDFIS